MFDNTIIVIKLSFKNISDFNLNELYSFFIET